MKKRKGGRSQGGGERNIKRFEKTFQEWGLVTQWLLKVEKAWTSRGKEKRHTWEGEGKSYLGGWSSKNPAKTNQH